MGRHTNIDDLRREQRAVRRRRARRVLSLKATRVVTRAKYNNKMLEYRQKLTDNQVRNLCVEFRDNTKYQQIQLTNEGQFNKHGFEGRLYRTSTGRVCLHFVSTPDTGCLLTGDGGESWTKRQGDCHTLSAGHWLLNTPGEDVPWIVIRFSSYQMPLSDDQVKRLHVEVRDETTDTLQRVSLENHGEINAKQHGIELKLFRTCNRAISMQFMSTPENKRVILKDGHDFSTKIGGDCHELYETKWFEPIFFPVGPPMWSIRTMDQDTVLPPNGEPVVGPVTKNGIVFDSTWIDNKPCIEIWYDN